MKVKREEVYCALEEVIEAGCGKMYDEKSKKER
jgi:hypothetical protein